MRCALLTALPTIALTLACEKSPPAPPAKTETQTISSAESAAKSPNSEMATGVRGEPRSAEVGKAAPDFVLPALDGDTLQLSKFKGKTIVLEWFNPGCPFVNLAHTKGPLADTAKRHTKDGVVWLAVNSGAAGKQGHDPEDNRKAKTRFGLEHPILLDASGEVGKAYGAERTPHIFVIDESFTLVYAGAADNSPDAEGESPTGDTVINYVDAAIEDVKNQRPVRTPRTEAYGCTVKYAG